MFSYFSRLEHFYGKEKIFFNIKNSKVVGLAPGGKNTHNVAEPIFCPNKYIICTVIKQ
jgi:hypothetical protein